MPSANQIEAQIMANYTEVDNIKTRLLTEKMPENQRLALRRRLMTVERAQAYWQREHTKRTGIPWQNLKETVVTNKPTPQEIFDNSLKKAKATSRRRAQNVLRGKVDAVRNHLRLLQDNINSAESDATKDFWHIMGSDLARTFSMTYWGTPMLIRKSTVPKAQESLRLAESALAAGNFPLCESHVQEAGKVVINGTKWLNRFLDEVYAGGDRAITTIKLSAALATAWTTGGASLGAWGAVGVGAFGKAVEEGTGLAAKGAGGENVSGQDYANAFAAVILEAGGAAAAEYVAGRFAAGLARRLFGESVSPGQLQLVTDALKSYVDANYKTITQAVVEYHRKGKKPDWKFWAAILFEPALKTISGSASTKIKS